MPLAEVLGHSAIVRYYPIFLFLKQFQVKRKNGEATVSPFFGCLVESDVLNGLGRTLGSAGAALQALILVDFIMELAHINCLSRALSSTGAAGQAFIGDNKSHDISSVKCIQNHGLPKWHPDFSVAIILTHRIENAIENFSNFSIFSVNYLR